MTWTRFTGQTITIETGPPNGILRNNLFICFLNSKIINFLQDVTTGTIFGHFMLFEPSTPSTVSGNKAILISPSKNDPSGKGCLEFYYNANGTIKKLFIK